VVIDHDNTTTIRIARSEMGQGSFTALAMLVAEELECDWSCVRADYVDTQENVVRGLSWGDMSTLASLAIRGSQAYLRKAGAQARTMLIAEAAHRWGVAAVECNARNSRVHHAATDKWLRYGELAQRASRRPVPVDVTLKPAAQWRLIGTSAPRHSRQGVGSTDLHRRLRSVRPAAASPVSHPSTIGEVASQYNRGSAKRRPQGCRTCAHELDRGAQLTCAFGLALILH
jgi:CO/xanthine dehydrogenase Mo-binding subunit